MDEKGGNRSPSACSSDFSAKKPPPRLCLIASRKREPRRTADRAVFGRTMNASLGLAFLRREQPRASQTGLRCFLSGRKRRGDKEARWVQRGRSFEKIAMAVAWITPTASMH